MAVKHIISKTWNLLPGADGRMRSNDPYGLVGNGLSLEQLRQQDYLVLVDRAREEARINDWTMQETREVLLAEIQLKSGQIAQPFEILLQAQIVLKKSNVAEGEIVIASSIPWRAIYDRIKKDPQLLENFAKHPRQFEEFIAGAYDAAGWDEVVLTPRSGDGGRDVIAVKYGFGSIRFLEQTKAYSPGHLVSHNDVRAMLGVLTTDPNSSKGLITTTSDFQPTVRLSPEFRPFLPHRLELKNGKELVKWLESI